MGPAFRRLAALPAAAMKHAAPRLALTALPIAQVAAATLLTVHAGAAAAQGSACRAAQKQMVVADLLFGRNIGGRLGVTESRWSRFLTREITPRFPDGLTVVDASGQWRDPDRNRIVRERSKLVTIVMEAAAQDKIDAIVEAYKRQFRQQSVGVVVRPACVSF
jgi:hypothetical protein